MKKITTLLLLALLPLIVKAYDAKIDGVYYNLNTETQNAYVTGLSSLSTYNKNAYKGNVTIPETIIYNGVTYSVTMIDQNAFYNCMGLKSVTIPNSVTVIGWSAFMDCTNLTSINIPNSVTSIIMNAFKFCKALTSVTIPNSVTEIGTWAFCGCSNLASITIGSRVKSIDKEAFIKCSSLKNVYCYANDIPTTGSDVFANSPIKNATLYVPTELIENYKITEPWSEFGSIVSLPSVVVEGIAINETNFPDVNFRNWVLSQSYGNDGILTEEEIADVTQISVIDENIQDLEGIEHFTALRTLTCWGNQLTSLDLSKNTALAELFCSDNQLTSLDLSKNTELMSLECYSNQLTSLDISKNTALMNLDCGDNQLTSLNVSGCTALNYLYCYSNQLTSLNVSKNTALKDLTCDNNRLTSLDVSKNTELTDLYCESNQLLSLDLSNNTELTTLYCYQNRIKGAEMDALVESLPTTSDGDGKIMVIYNEDEGNVMTTTQVATAKVKGWTPYYTEGELDDYDDVIWLEYAGGNDDILRGDANGDGKIDMDDATFVTNIILGTEDATEAADVNLDGKISMPDVMYIMNYIKNGKFPDEKIPGSPEDVLGNSEKVDGHDCVDLGLSVKWATCNIDAIAPEDYGSYFAWGELNKKDSYTLENYSLYQNGSYANYGNDISETAHDVAYVKWGYKWRMPTYQECKELEEKCSFSWVNFKGVEGCLVTGPNGNKLFLPASGRIEGSIKGFEKNKVNVWGSVLWPWGNHYDITQCNSAVLLSVGLNSTPSFENLNRHVGCPIRAVTTAIPEPSNDNNSDKKNN